MVKKHTLRSTLVALFLLFTVAGCSSSYETLSTPQATRTFRAAVFQGDCSACTQAVVQALHADPRRDWQVQVVKDRLSQRLSGKHLFVIPGGNEDVEDTWRRMTLADRRAVNLFVRRGGNYLGICMGAFLTGDFTEDGVRVGWRWLPSADTYTGPLRGTRLHGIVSTRWILAGKARTRQMYFSEGTTFGKSLPRGAQLLARYGNGEIAALIKPVDRGSVAVVGPHPEADASWYSAKRMGDSDGYDRDLLHHTLDKLMVGR